MQFFWWRKTILFCFLVVVITIGFFVSVKGATNPEINYQGKLFGLDNKPVGDGDYKMRFELFTQPSGGVAIWTEDRTTTPNLVTLRNGLFSVMLGEISSLSAVDFNQTLYLEVSVGTSSLETMSPRKILGTVPAAFTSAKLNGKTWESPGAIGGTTASTAVFTSVTSTGNLYVGGLLSVIGNASFGNITSGTWSGNIISTTFGGTGTSTIGSIGSLIYSNGSSYDFLIPSSTNGLVLQMQNNNPIWVATNTLGLGTVGLGTVGQIPYYSTEGTVLSATSAIFIAASGNVGIGTTTPSAKLQISQSNDSVGLKINGYDDMSGYNVTMNVDSAGTGQLDATGGWRLKHNGSNIAYADSSTLNGFRMYNDIPVSFGTTAATRFSLGYVSASDTLNLSYGGGISDKTKIKLIITSSSYVGIGTSTPAYHLSVVGDINTTGTYRINGIDYGQYFIDSAGTLGQLWQSDGNGRGIWINTSSLGIVGLPAGLAGQILLNSGGSNWTPTSIIFVSSSGNVGIGTTTPGYNLTVTGDVNITGNYRINGASGTIGQVLMVSTTGNQAWTNTSSLGITATGAAGGDLVGNYPNPSIAIGVITPLKVATNTTPGASALLAFNSNSQFTWVPSTTFAYALHNQPTSTIDGIFGIASGGTNTSTLGSAGTVVYSNGTTYAFTAVGTSGQILQSNGSGSPIWVNTTSLGIVPSGLMGQILYYPANGYNLIATSAIFVSSSGNIGIGTTNPLAKLSLAGDGAILAIGTYGSGWTGGTLSAGTRLMWIPNKAAIRAGNVSSYQWNEAYIGNYSVAFGQNNIASNTYSAAIGGSGNTASGQYSFVGGGYNNQASGSYTTVGGGYANRSSNTYAIVAGGYNNAASGLGSAILGGMSNTSSGSYSLVLGNYSSSTNAYAVAIGRYIKVSGYGSLGINVSSTPVELSTQNTIALMGGNVGIGTTTPGYNLTITGDVNITGNYRINGASGTIGQILMVSSTGNQVWANTSSLGLGTVLYGQQGNVPYYASNGTILTAGSLVYVTTTGEGRLGINTNNPLTLFSVNGTSSFVGGYVGIGTTTPDSSLTVIGTTTIMGYTVIGPNDTSRIVFRTVSNTNEGMIRIFNGVNWGLLMRSDANAPKIGAATGGSLHIAPFSSSVGDLDTSKGTLAIFDFDNMGVGIGTTTPSEILTIVKNGSATSRLQLYNNSGPVAFKLSNVSTTGREYGISSENGGNMGFYDYTSGSFRMIIDKTGNVGIGTTSLISILNIKSRSQEVASNDELTINLIQGYVTGTWQTGDKLGAIAFRTLDTSGIGPREVGRIEMFDDGSVNNTTMRGAMAFYTSAYNSSSFERMRISSTGNVGIGTTSPVFKLTLGNDGGIYSASSNYDLLFGFSGFSGTTLPNSSGTLMFWYPRKGAFRSGLINRVDANGTAWDDSSIGVLSAAFGYNNVNFGTSSFVGGGAYNVSSGSLSFVAGGYNNVVSGDSSFVSGQNNLVSGHRSFIGSGSTNIASGESSFVGSGFYNIASGDYSFVGGGTYNTASGIYSFVGGGNNNKAYGNYSAAFGKSMTVSGNNSFGINLHSSNSYTLSRSSVMAIMGGNVGIGTTTPSTTLFVQGTAGGSSAWVNYSDENLKTNIVTIENALSKVLSLRGVSFDWKDPSQDFPGRKIGLIAQETINVVPEVVNKVGDVYGIQYASLTALLIEAIKEQQAQIDALKNATTTLTVENNNNNAIVYTVDMGQDMLGRPLLNVASIIGANNKWEIDSNGTLIAKIITVSGAEKKLYGMASENIEMTINGEGKLQNGEARVVFSDDIQQIIDDTAPIKVNVTLTSLDTSNSVAVINKDKTGFTVKELNSGVSSATFDWFVVAKRKSTDGSTDTSTMPVEPTTSIVIEEPTVESNFDEGITPVLTENQVVKTIPFAEETATSVVETLPTSESVVVEVSSTVIN